MFCQPKKYYEYYKCPVIRTCPPRKGKIIVGPLPVIPTPGPYTRAPTPGPEIMTPDPLANPDSLYLVTIGYVPNSIKNSKDGGISWKKSTNPEMVDFFTTFGTSVCYDKKNDVFIACGFGSENKWEGQKMVSNNRSVAYSKDGIDWIAGNNTESGKGINILENYNNRGGGGRCVIANNQGTTVVVGNGLPGRKIARSVDGGMSWTICNYPNIDSTKNNNGYDNIGEFWGICSDGSGFVAVGSNVDGAAILYSEDGINWNSPKIDLSKSEVLYSVCYNGFDTFVAVGQYSQKYNLNGNPITGETTIYYSKDGGKSWTGIDKSIRSFHIGTGVCWDGQQFVAIGNSGDSAYLLYSKDGINWSQELQYDNNFIENNDNFGKFYLGNFVTKGVYWSGHDLFVYGKKEDGKPSSIMKVKIEKFAIPTQMPWPYTYTPISLKKGVELRKSYVLNDSDFIFGMCSKYIPNKIPAICGAYATMTYNNDSSVCVCDKGYYLNESSTCEKCGAGYYCPDGIDKIPCTSGSTVDQKDGATNLSDCFDCEKGTITQPYGSKSRNGKTCVCDALNNYYRIKEDDVYRCGYKKPREKKKG